MPNLYCSNTVIQNVSGATQFFGFIPPHGKVLENNARETIEGNIWSRIKNKRALASFLYQLNNGGVNLLSQPSAPCAEPAATGVTVTSGSNTITTIDIEFSDLVDSTSALVPANYTITGAGVGTLQAHPTGVALKGGTASTYTLTWTSVGELKAGSTISIDASGVKDTAGTYMTDHSDPCETGTTIAVLPRVVTLTQPGVVPGAGKVNIQFSELMNEALAEVPASYTVSGTGAGTMAITAVEKTADLVYELTYSGTPVTTGGNAVTITVSTNVKDLAGNPMDTATNGNKGTYTYAL